MIEEKRVLVPTTCLECVLQIVAFKEDGDPRMNSVHITLLSSSYHWYARSIKGRLNFAWKALMAKPTPDIDLMTGEDITAFKYGMQQIDKFLNG